MAAIKVIDDERDIEAWINPASVSMWRAHWTGPGEDSRGHDHERTDVFFVGEDDALVVRMPPAKFAAAWLVAKSDGGEW